MLISLLGINGVPGVVDDEQEVGHAPAIHPAGPESRKRENRALNQRKVITLRFLFFVCFYCRSEGDFPVHRLLYEPRGPRTRCRRKGVTAGVSEAHRLHPGPDTIPTAASRGRGQYSVGGGLYITEAVEGYYRRARADLQEETLPFIS